MEIEKLYQLYQHSKGVTTDSRKIENGQIYFALKGKNFDGNSFAGKAIEQGAPFSIIDNVQFKINEKCIVVNDVLSTLQQLGNYHLKQVNPKAIIAITGSNGKTTTKELVHAVLATTFPTHYTKENLNNHIGIPLTLLDMAIDTEIAVIEMGANHQKEIEQYCSYVEPTHGIITNCGKAHLEGFGGIEGVQKGKGELYDYLLQHHGIVFVNGDDTVLLNMLHERNFNPFITYGKNIGNTFGSKILKEQPFLKIKFEDVEISSTLFGSYNYSNIMCAIAVGKHFGVSNQQIKQAIENYNPTNARSQVIEKKGCQIILDSYNANPTSMQHALESFAKSSIKKKIVILGDMFELGEFASQEHQKIADLATCLNFDKIVLVGNEFSKTTTAYNVIKFENSTDTQAWFSQQNFDDSIVLLKGSRSMKMERVIE